MSEQYRYRLQRKEPYSMPNILGNCSMPVYTDVKCEDFTNE